MSIFKRALEVLTGKKELQEQINKLKEESISKEQLVEAAKSVISQEKPCRNKTIYNVNNGSIRVITCDRDVFNGFNIASDIVEQLKTADNETIIRLLTPKEEIKNVIESSPNEQEKELVSNFLDIFDGVDDFEVKDKNVYFKGVNIAIPSLIVAAFVELIEKINYLKEQFFDDHAAFETEKTLQLASLETEYKSLKAFTTKLLLNPIEESRETLLNFVRENNIQLTNRGNMVLYRRIVSKGKKDKSYIHFITESYIKVKHQKQSPKNYWVSFDDENTKEYKLTKHQYTEFNDLGNLYELYQSLGEETTNTFTDNHTKSYDIKIGQVYKINEEEIQLNRNGSCGGLLHACNPEEFNYGAFGDTDVMVLVNPSKAARMDTGCKGKIGVEEMFICCINNIYIKQQEIVDFDEFYDQYTIEQLEIDLRNKSLKNVSIAEVNSDLSLVDVENLKNLLKNRVVNI